MNKLAQTVIFGQFGVMVETARSVSEQPEVSVSSWRIAETTDGTRHVIGMETMDYGRCSTPIEAVDLDKMVVVTASGRVYQLVGEPGQNSVSERVWKYYCTHNGLTEVV